MLLHSEFTAPRAPRRGRARRAAPARARVAGVDGRQPRQPPVPDPLGQERSRTRTRAALVMLMGLRGTPFLYYGDEIGMPDTDVPHGPDARPGRRVPRAAHGSRPRAHADAVDAASRARASPSRASSRGSPTATSPRATWPTSATIPTRCSRSPAISSACATRCPSSATARTDAAELRTTTCGCGCAASAPSSRATSPTSPSTSPTSGPGAIRISTIRARDDERVDGSLHLAPWEAAIVWRDA